MIDMGIIKGERVFYTGGRSLAQLIEDGEVAAIPDSEDGISFKRTEICTPLELAAKLTVEEVREIVAKWRDES